MPIKRLTGDYARTTVGANPGIDTGLVISVTGDIATGFPLIYNLSSITGLVAGQTITGTGLPANTTILKLVGNEAVLNQDATATATGSAFSVAGATQVIGLQDWSISFKVKTIDATTTDEDGWEDSLPSSASWTAKATYVYLMGDPSQEANVRAIIGAGIGRRGAVQWNFFLDSTSGDDSFTGLAYITGLGVAAAVGDTVRMDVSLKGVGPVALRNRATFQASLVLPTGSIAYTISRSLGNNSFAALWTNFQLIDELPPDAVITGIYPVIIASANYDGAFQYLTSGAGLTFEATGGGFPSPPSVLGASFASTEFYGVSIGTTLSALVGQGIQAMLQSSLDVDVKTDTLTVAGLGLAILYTSAIPTTDPIMPPPFAVPSGSGLAWALPFSVQQSGGPYNFGLGLFSPSSGEGLGTPAISEV